MIRFELTHDAQLLKLRLFTKPDVQPQFDVTMTARNTPAATGELALGLERLAALIRQTQEA